MSNNKSYVVYKGLRFTIEWYVNDIGNSEALQYFSKLDASRKAKLTKLLIWMGDLGHINNEEKFRHEADKIYVFKPKPDRFFCFFFTGSKIIITNAYEKKSDKMPSREFDKAERALRDYMIRCKQGIYYEKINQNQKK